MSDDQTEGVYEVRTFRIEIAKKNAIEATLFPRPH